MKVRASADALLRVPDDQAIPGYAYNGKPLCAIRGMIPVTWCKCVQRYPGVERYAYHGVTVHAYVCLRGYQLPCSLVYASTCLRVWLVHGLPELPSPRRHRGDLAEKAPVGYAVTRVRVYLHNTVTRFREGRSENLDSKSDSISAREAEFTHKRGQGPNVESIA